MLKNGLKEYKMYYEDEFTESSMAEFKWPIVVMFTVLLGFGAMMLKNYNSSVEKIEKIKQGLEECPMFPDGSSFATIWVKDCDKYIENFKKRKENEKNN